MRTFGVFRVLALSLLLASCVTRDLDALSFTVQGRDGGGGAGECNASFSACGGDPVGVWTHQETCGVTGFAEMVMAVCSTAQIERDVQTNSGDLEITQLFYDLENARKESLLEAVWPPACIQSTCAAEAPRIMAAIPSSDDALCTESAGVCRCRVTASRLLSIASDYIPDGSLIDLSAVSLPSQRFCVEGDQLLIKDDCAAGPGCEHADLYLR